MFFDLDDPRALDPLVAGVKAARLAAARRAGLPILDGLIVGASEGVAAMAAGEEAIEGGRPGHARSAAWQARTDAELAAVVAPARRLGPSLVVRSSSRLDDDGRWAGTFATFGDVHPDEVVTAIRGCWASVFAPATLERFEQAGRRPVDAGLAVLIQPQVRPDAGGWAVVRGSGAEIVSVAGSPGPLFGGWVAGERITVDARGAVTGPPGPISADDARAIGSLLDRVSGEFGADRIEWASIGGSLVLFQLEAGAAPAIEAPEPAVAGPIPERYRWLAAELMDRRGALFDRLMAPWVLAAPDDLRPTPWDGDGASAWIAARREGDALTGDVARGTGLDVTGLLERMARADAELLVVIDGLRVDPDRAGRLLGAVDAVAAALVAAGRLPHPAAIWWQSEAWVARAIEGDAPGAAIRHSSDRFAELLFAGVTTAGASVSAVGASPGRAVGRAAHLASPERPGQVAPGSVLIVDAPDVAYAPLLWSARGLVAMTGGPAAHLCEVARSLRIPAVVAARGLDHDLLAGDVAVAIDGSSGEIRTARSLI